MNTLVLDYLENWLEELQPLDFYRAIFPPGELAEQGKQQIGKYNAIAVELQPKESEIPVKRYLIHDDLKGIEQLLQSDNFIIIAPVSYAGKSRISANGRFLYSLGIDLDGIEKPDHLRDLFHQFEHEVLPKPTYIVFSGNGIHLYYHLQRPLPLYNNIKKQLAELKRQLTWKIWNKYVTTLYNNIQYEALLQGFRLVGGITKDGKNRTKAFYYGSGQQVTIEYLNSFVDEKYRVTDYKYKSDLTLAEAAEKYPEWYDKRIVKNQKKGSWIVKKDLYYWWINRIKGGAKVGHRYYCMMCLAIYAAKCGVSREELEKDAFGLVELFDSKSESEENRFTRQDVLSALQMYDDNYTTFPIQSISSLTDIEIERNKRNYRTQAAHLKIARFTKQVMIDEGKDVKGGRPSKDHMVKEWQQRKPGGTKAECARETGLSPKTIRKYWV